MNIENIYDQKVTENFIARLEKLNKESQPTWGKMNAAQMLAHLNVSYTQAKHQGSSPYSWLTKLMLKSFVKKIVVGPAPYKKNNRTAPAFVISDERDFQKEKAELIANMKEVQAQGASHFEGKESLGFGKLTASEWNNLFSKHLMHHYEQFGI